MITIEILNDFLTIWECGQIKNKESTDIINGLDQQDVNNKSELF